MAKRKVALLMPVGTGVGGTQEGVDSLGHGLLFLINSKNPDYVVFFGSEVSKKTIESIKRQYFEEEGEEFDYYEFIDIEDVDNFEKYFNAFKSKIMELEEDYKIIMDYTSGTKTMTMASAFASMVMRKQLFFVTGKREGGTVVYGTEDVTSQNLYPVYDGLMLNKLKESFNFNRFESAKALLEEITATSLNKEAYSNLLNAYACFDNVDYDNAIKYFDISSFSKEWSELSKEFGMNMKSLNILTKKEHNLRCYYVLASMLNNARRRYEENKFDDAIARLYRSLELIGQIRLKNEYGLVTSDIDMNYLKEKGVEESYLEILENSRDSRSKKVKIGLIQDFVLLSKLGDDLGEFYLNNEKLIQNTVKFRNNSILAHGFESKSKEEYEEFRDIVLKAANVLNSKMDKFIQETRFPEFK